MSDAIARAFARARSQGRAVFMPFLTAGFPDPESFLDILAVLADEGADLIEVGLPFSDPLADGPVIQAASRQALESGVTPPAVLDLLARAGARAGCPLALMTYYNPVWRMGPARFAAGARQAGAAGVIVPDLPPEEAQEWLAAARGEELDTIFLTAPTTTQARLGVIAAQSRGFVYHVAVTGVTGSAHQDQDHVLADLARIKAAVDLPVALGFGVSRPDQAARLARAADGVIVGSALVKAVAEQPTRAGQVAAAGRLARDFAAAMVKPVASVRAAGAAGEAS